MAGDSTLRAHIRSRAENRPGVYRLYDKEDRLVYVGKSVRVRARLLSYFRAPAGEKAAEIIAEARRAEWEHVADEFGALIREMQLIQRHRPRYNTQHKRTRPYAFLKLTLAEPAPRLLAVARVVEDGSLYFGPFGRARAVRDAARELATVLGLRDCPRATPVFWRDQLELFEAGRLPGCIRAELGSCLAPCCGRSSEGAYRLQVGTARGFLEGQSREPLRILEERMRGAAAHLDFEYAARLRDRRDRLAALRDELAAFRGEVEGLSFVYRVPGFGGAGRLYLIRGGRVREELPDPVGGDARVRVQERVEAVFGEPERGLAALAAGDAAEILLVAAWFRGRPHELARTMAPREWLAEGTADDGRALRTRKGRP